MEPIDSFLLIAVLSCLCTLIIIRSWRNCIWGLAGRSLYVPNIDKPSIFFGQILHIRRFPALHSFRYAYLLVGVPVSYNYKLDSTIVSVDSGTSTNRRWLRVEAEDHFGRGGNTEGLRKKLDHYLESQGMNPARFEKVYLVTAPRILNYHFTPASFWYLYTKNNKLDVMIAEVNNTFNERRIYVVTGEYECDPPNMAASISNADMPNISGWFRSKSFLKDFHVSPFSSRKGGYLLSARNLLTAARSLRREHSESYLDIRVKLLSSKGHLKLYARTWCDNRSVINAESMSKAKFLALIVIWFWMARITYCLIVIEALKLSWICKLHMWYRPEPRKESIPRRATAAEKVLSKALYKYLVWLGRTSGHYSVVNSEDSGDGYIQKYSLRPDTRQPGPNFDLYINTPALYSSIPGNDNVQGFLEDILLDCRMENRTASCSQHPEGLINLIDSASQNIGLKKYASSGLPQTPLTLLLWYLIWLVPLKPPPTPYPRKSSMAQDRQTLDPSGKNIPSQRHYTFLFDFIQMNYNAREQWQFQVAILRVLGWRLLVTLSGGLLSWGT